MEVFGRFQLRFDGGLTVSVVLVGGCGYRWIPRQTARAWRQVLIANGSPAVLEATRSLSDPGRCQLMNSG
jgi:hypothetical protein